jgi:hypothetical protein
VSRDAVNRSPHLGGHHGSITSAAGRAGTRNGCRAGQPGHRRRGRATNPTHHDPGPQRPPDCEPVGRGGLAQPACRGAVPVRGAQLGPRSRHHRATWSPRPRPARPRPVPAAPRPGSGWSPACCWAWSGGGRRGRRPGRLDRRHPPTPTPAGFGHLPRRSTLSAAQPSRGPGCRQPDPPAPPPHCPGAAGTGPRGFPGLSAVLAGGRPAGGEAGLGPFRGAAAGPRTSPRRRSCAGRPGLGAGRLR